MEYQNLPIIVLSFVLVGMVIGMGVLILDKFGDAVAETAIITNESVTMPARYSTVKLSNGNLTAFTQLLNISGSAQPTGNYTIDLTNGILNNTGNTSTCERADTCYAYYTYTQTETKTKISLVSARDAVSAIADTWMSLIVTIVVLAILLYMVIRSFQMGRT